LIRQFKFSYLFSCFLIGYQTCGSYYESCYNPTYPTPSSDISPALIIVIVIVTLVICVTFLSCCIRSQQQPQHIRSTYNPNAQRVAYPYQQQSSRQPSRVVHVRPVYNVGAAPTIHSTYEAPPPSYEAATRNLPPKYPSASLEPGIATIEQMNSRV